MEITTLEVFGKILFGSCAEDWLKLCKDKKKEWILKHTQQKDETLISEFINNPNISKECKCLDCGKNKKDVASGISETVATVIEPANGSKNSRGNNSKRSKTIKERKD